MWDDTRDQVYAPLREPRSAAERTAQARLHANAQHFAAYDWYDGRMLGSKLEYSNSHVDDLVVFNANILMPNIGKVLYADVNLTEDYLILQQIAQSLNTTLYVLWEMDARFGNENKPMDELLGKAVWNTDEEKPTKQWYLNKSKKLTWDKVL